VKSSNANKDLINLLIDSLQVFEPHPDLFIQEQCTESSIDDNNAFIIMPSDQWQDYSVINYMRMESLTWLGAQTISTRSLLNLAAVLKPGRSIVARFVDNEHKVNVNTAFGIIYRIPTNLNFALQVRLLHTTAEAIGIHLKKPTKPMCSGEICTATFLTLAIVTRMHKPDYFASSP
ncbi:unnamed protein product, partial [Trichobilharzia regenti]